MKISSQLVLSALLLAASSSAFPQAYPTKPIRIVVPLSAGGTTDVVMRLISPKLSESLGQQVVIDNRPGAGGNIGANVVAKATPDGYTLLMGTSSSHGTNVTLYSKMPYDAVNDFTPITLVGYVPFIMMVHPSLGVTSVKELIALAKSKPGQINYASSGNGTSSHLGMEMLKTMAGIDLIHIPYKGTAPANQDLLAGHVSIQFDGVPAALPFIRSGKVRGLAVTSPKRISAAPELPTIAESGVPGFEYTAWVGIMAPAGIPREIVARLNTEITRILNLPEIKDRLLALGFEAAPSTPEQFATHIKTEIAKWEKVVKASGARLD